MNVLRDKPPEGKQTCRVCNSDSGEVIYDGPIRSGGIGSPPVDGFRILRCTACGFVFLDPIPADLNEFYETEEYRLRFFDQTDVASLQAKYDHEQNARIGRIGVQTLRNRVVADFGAGAGLFLDAVQGIAKRTLAVEPSKQYREYFASRGHIHYGYVKDLIEANEKVEIAVSFDAIEHILDLKEFANQICRALVDDGVLFLSMPNHRDLVREVFPGAFEPFFYQVSHLNYFNDDSARLLLNMAGFGQVAVGYLHKYTIDNLLQWAGRGEPGLLDSGTAFDVHFHDIYRTEIERLGLASHLFIVASK